MLVQVIGTGCLVQVDWYRLVQVYWYRLLQVIGTGDRLTVAVVDSVTVTGCLHLAFIFQGGWMGQGQVVVATFRL
jgi:hypothetical protein